jgi:hypothetical protein
METTAMGWTGKTHEMPHVHDKLPACADWDSWDSRRGVGRFRQRVKAATTTIMRALDQVGGGRGRQKHLRFIALLRIFFSWQDLSVKFHQAKVERCCRFLPGRSVATPFLKSYTVLDVNKPIISKEYKLLKEIY